MGDSRLTGASNFWARGTLVAAAGVALADGSIVTLALPQLLRELHTSVEGVAAVLIVYCATLAVTLPLSRRLGKRVGLRPVGIAGLVVFAAASAVCAAAGSLSVLLVARCVQAASASAVLLFAFAVLGDSRWEVTSRRRNLWRLAAILGTAAGPAFGGAVTQAFSWQAIFLVQAPLALAAAQLSRNIPVGLVVAPGQSAGEPASRHRAAARLALAAIAAALSAILFLLILLLVIGGGLSPLGAAAEVSVIPVSTIVAARVRGRAHDRGAVGCLALGAAVLSLAFVPNPSIWWLIVPEVLAGTGIGLALPALEGELLPEQTTTQASHLLAIRFAGIAITLIAIAPLISSQLAAALHQARLEGVAALVASPLSPTTKLSLAPRLATSLNTEEPHEALVTTVARASPGLGSSDRSALRKLQAQGDAIIFRVAGDGLRDAFLIAGVLALLGAALLRPRWRVHTAAIVVAATVALPCSYALAAEASRPAPPATGAPCHPTGLPDQGGVQGLIQDAALTALDQVACAGHIGREQLLLQIAKIAG
jgi:MFS family permease